MPPNPQRVVQDEQKNECSVGFIRQTGVVEMRSTRRRVHKTSILLILEKKFLFFFTRVTYIIFFFAYI